MDSTNKYVFDEKIATPLCEIMGRNKSDKGHLNITRCWHNYTTVYYNIFKDIQHNNLRVFELGLGTNNINIPSNMGINGRPGASLFGWAEFFTNSKIYGADIDRNILFNTDKIKTFYCDQTNPQAIQNMWNESELLEPFDIIIEDGLHTFNANVCFFENSVHKLAKNGYYIIEDIHVNDFNNFNNKVNDWKTTYPHLEYTLLHIPCVVNPFHNSILIIKYA
jgi:hypothetical protein